MRERGDQKGLDTPVVHAVNDDLSMNGEILNWHSASSLEGEAEWQGVLVFVLANALNGPPEEYGRKIKTQRNRRGLTQVVEHVV